MNKHTIIPRLWFWRRFYVNEPDELNEIRVFIKEATNVLRGYPYHIIGPYFTNYTDYKCYYDFRIGLSDSNIEDYNALIDSLLHNTSEISIKYKDIDIEEFYNMYSQRFNDAQMQLILSHFKVDSINLLTPTLFNDLDYQELPVVERRKAIIEMLHLMNFNYGDSDTPLAFAYFIHSLGYLGHYYPLKRIIFAQKCLYYSIKFIFWLLGIKLLKVVRENTKYQKFIL